MMKRTRFEPKVHVHACQPLCIHVSVREQQVIKSVASGRSLAKIALDIRYTEAGVFMILARLRARVGLHTRAELIAWALRNGVIK